jgi:hypothetical protein
MSAVMEELQSRSDTMADEVFESMDANKVAPPPALALPVSLAAEVAEMRRLMHGWR